MEKIPVRSEVAEQYKWKLTDIFPNDEAWEQAFHAFEARIKEFQAYDGHVAEQPETVIRAYFAMSEELDPIACYAMLRQECDNGDTSAQALSSRSESLAVSFYTAASFLEPELLAMDDTALEALMSAPEMADYSEFLRSLLKEKIHSLPKEQEKLLAMAGEMAQAPNAAYNMLTSVDMKFPGVPQADGTVSELTEGNFSNFRSSADREQRRIAFENIMNTYGSFGNTIAATYAANVKKDAFYAKARKYATPRNAALDPLDIPLTVYDNLIEVMHESLPILQDYLAVRKKLLKVDELHMYDLYCPIVGDFEMKLPYEKAFDLVLEGLKPMQDDYIEVLKEARDNGWIDVYPTVNKSSGAFSLGSLGNVHPYVLLNHNDNIDSAFTIAHELGHSMHSWFSNHAQPYPKRDYSLFVAEVASTCNEAVMMRYLLETMTDPKAQAYLLNYYLEQFRTTCFRQTMFAEFEKIVHDMDANGEPLTKESLNKVYYDLNKLYYGSECVVDEWIANEWQRIPHFYRSFYVYVYATSLCASISISERILNEGAPAVADYRKFLSAGCSVPPIEALKLAGIDMSSPKPLRNAMRVFRETLERFKKVMEA